MRKQKSPTNDDKRHKPKTAKKKKARVIPHPYPEPIANPLYDAKGNLDFYNMLVRDSA